MVKVRGDAMSRRPVQFGGIESVDPRLRYLLRRGYMNKGTLATILQVPEVKNDLLEVTLAGKPVNAKVLYDIIQPVYDDCITDGKAARAKGYPTACVRSCHNKLDALVNPVQVAYAGPVDELNGVKFFTKDAVTGDILEVKLKK